MKNTYNPISDTADLIRAIHSDQFPKVLDTVCSNAASFDSAVIYAYTGDTPPIDLFHSDSSHALDDYQSKAYQLDPFYHACQNGISPGVYRLKELAPDHFFRSEYYRSYYSATKIIDEIGIFIPIGSDKKSSGSNERQQDTANQTVIVVSLSREEGSTVYRKKEIERLVQIEPVIREAIIHHWRNPEIQELTNPPQKGRFDALPARVQDATTKLNKPSLTNRESEVVGLILRGYSSISIAAMLDISVSTVKVHRKNIYAKMHISSQAELFSMFLPLLVNPAAWESHQHEA